MKTNYKRYFDKYLQAIIVLVAFALTGCDYIGTDNRILNAIEILKKNMDTPATFSLVKGEVAFSGRDANGKPAYIVKLEYDSQNINGAMVRQCNLVAYVDNGKTVSWNMLRAFAGCGTFKMWDVFPIDISKEVLDSLKSSNEFYDSPPAKSKSK
jgi:hypothetical protein